MFHLKINDRIKKLLEASKTGFGCIESCPEQFIAFDAFQLMVKSLGKSISSKEIEEIQSSTVIYRLPYLHVCKVETKDDEISDEEIKRQLNTDKLPLKEEDNLLKNAFIDYQKILLEKKINEKDNVSSSPQTEEKENTVTFGFNMIGSLLLLVLGGYYLGKYYFQMDDGNTYKLVLVVTIIVVFAEAMLLILKLDKYSKTAPTPKQMENSFAYRFNQSYRNKYNFPKGKRIFY